MKLHIRHILAAMICLAAAALNASAQFREEAFTQTYASPNDTLGRDTTESMFSLREFFDGVSHKRQLRVGTLFAGSTVFIGSEQIYNRQYWKLPVIYGGIGAGVGMGLHYNSVYQKSKNAYEAAFAADPSTSLTVDTHAKRMRNYFFAGAALVYWCSLADGVYNYRTEQYPHPGKATLYSVLCPGLGQIYNGEMWKVPLYWGCLAGSAHFLVTNDMNYKRFKRIHNEATSPDIEYDGPISGETAKYYRDSYRRLRDYSIVAVIGFYLLQVIDANVFSYMQDFDLGDDISMQISPSVLLPDNAYAAIPSQPSAVGLKLGFNF